jgi:hypothetical protein
VHAVKASPGEGSQSFIQPTQSKEIAVPLGVHSEVGRLRRVMVHRPGLEHSRLTPSNAEDLLFDDVLWVARAKWSCP